MRYNISPSPVFVPESSAYFKASKALFKEKTSLNISHRLHILEYLNKFEEKMGREAFITWKTDKIYFIE
jgi:hypothetical protein